MEVSKTIETIGLYRGKRITDGEWVVGYVYPGVGRDKGKWFITETYHMFTDSRTFEVIPHTIGKATLLEDKNSIAIYEGDLIDIPGSKKKGLPGYIKYRPKEASFWLCRKGYNPIWLAEIDTWGIVVGNIYDNPELIGGG